MSTTEKATIDEFMVLDALNIALRELELPASRYENEDTDLDKAIEHVKWARDYLAKAWNRDPQRPGRGAQLGYSKSQSH